jgi:type I restriction enzyme S subunit
LELVGRAAIFRDELPGTCFTNTLIRFRAEAGVSPEFALSVFRHDMHSGSFRVIAKITTNIAHLGAGRFASLAFPLASSQEQREVVRLLSEHCSEVDSLEATIARALKQSTVQCQSILRAASAGDLVPQDPNDEPASVLLERIRAERAAQGPAKKRRGRRTLHEA